MASTIPRSRSPPTTRGCRSVAEPAPPPCSPGPRGCGRVRTWRRRWMSCSWTKQARYHWPTCWRRPQGRQALVLLGDPQQLDQPTQGAHPPGADRSALAHLLDEHPTMPDHLGLFLETTWRLHPDLCDFTSEVFYEDRLKPESHLAGQLLRGSPPTTGTGPRLLPVIHQGNDNDSVEEAEVVASICRTLVNGGTWVDRERSRDARSAGTRRPRRGRVQRPGRRDPQAAARRAGRARSTSSRARRRRSRSTAWRRRRPRTRPAA